MPLKTSWIGLLVALCLAWWAPPELDPHLDQIARCWRAGPADQWLEQLSWMIEHHPDSKLFREEYTLWVIPPGAETAGGPPIRAQLAAAWLRQVDRNPASAVIDNAYRAVVQNDFAGAESLLKRARRLYPAYPHWTDLLANLCVSAVVPSWRHSHMANPELITPAIADRVMRELTASNDTALLEQAGEIASMPENPLLRQVFGPSLGGDAWGERLLARARRLKPNGAPRRQPRPTGPIRVGTSISKADYLLRNVVPKYPADARKAHIQGYVTISILVRIDGTVEELQVLRGHPLLVPAAEQAFRQRRYKPLLLNGEPICAITVAEFEFLLSQ